MFIKAINNDCANIPGLQEVPVNYLGSYIIL